MNLGALKIDFNTAQFRSAAQDAVQKMGANAPLLIKEEARLFIQEFMKLSPPFAKGAFGKNIGTAEDKKAGKGAIKRDMREVADGAETQFLQFVVDTFGATQIKQQLFKKGTSKPYLIDWDKVAFSIGELHAHHVKKRDRYGHTTSRKKGMGGRGTGDKTIGRWVAREKLIVPNHVLAGYLKQLYDAVGSAKATFNEGAFRLDVKRIPPWVRKQGNLGSYYEENKPTFSVTLGGQSQVPGAQDTVNKVIALRGKKLEAELKRIMSTFAKTGKIATRRASFNTPP